MTIPPLKRGDDSRFNWKTINQVIAEQGALWDKNRVTDLAIAELRRRHLDAGGGRIETYRVKSKIGDAMVCRTWDAATETEGDTDVWVATNFESRQLATEVTDDMGTFTYSDYTPLDDFNDSRTSDDGTTEETQVVTPLWFPDCIIAVANISSTGVLDEEENDIKLIEVSSRCWAKMFEEEEEEP